VLVLVMQIAHDIAVEAQTAVCRAWTLVKWGGADAGRIRGYAGIGDLEGAAGNGLIGAVCRASAARIAIIFPDVQRPRIGEGRCDAHGHHIAALDALVQDLLSVERHA